MDPISDMLIQIKNAGNTGNAFATTPYSKIKFEIADILFKHAFIKGFNVKGKKVHKRIEIEVAYKKNKNPKIENIKRLSKPARRLYTGFREIKRLPGFGLAILSTPQGIMTGDDAQKAKLGGELLFRIW